MKKMEDFFYHRCVENWYNENEETQEKIQNIVCNGDAINGRAEENGITN